MFINLKTLSNRIILALLWLNICYALSGDVTSTSGEIIFKNGQNDSANLSTTGFKIGEGVASANLDVNGTVMISQSLGVGSTAIGSSNLHIQGSYALVPMIVSTTGANITNASMILADSSSDNIWLVLPPSSALEGQIRWVKKISLFNEVVVMCNGGFTVQQSVALGSGNMGSVKFVASSGNWLILDMVGETTKDVVLYDLFNDNKRMNTDSFGEKDEDWWLISSNPSTLFNVVDGEGNLLLDTLANNASQSGIAVHFPEVNLANNGDQLRVSFSLKPVANMKAATEATSFFIASCNNYYRGAGNVYDQAYSVGLDVPTSGYVMKISNGSENATRNNAIYESSSSVPNLAPYNGTDLSQIFIDTSSNTSMSLNTGDDERYVILLERTGAGMQVTLQDRNGGMTVNDASAASTIYDTFGINVNLRSGDEDDLILDDVWIEYLPGN